MSTVIEEIKVNLECRKNGERIVHPFYEAYRQFWDCNYSWLVPSDWYRWQVDGHSGATYVYPVVKRAAMRLGFLVHTRKEPLTIDELEAIDKAKRELTVDAFVARAYRFNLLFGDLPKELRPFQYLDVLNKMGIARPAYRMNPQRTCFVVLGGAPGNSRTDIDWSLFCQPPDPCKASASQPTKKTK